MRTTIRINDELLKRVEIRAAETDRILTEVIEDALPGEMDRINESFELQNVNIPTAWEQDGRVVLIILDANILIYAFRKDTEYHAQYRTWLEEILTEVEVVGISELVLSSVVRITTHPKIFIKPSSLDEVFQFIDYIHSCSNVVSVTPGRTPWSILQ